MLRIRIASRLGNIVLAVLGGLYSVAAMIVSVLLFIDAGVAMAALDVLLQIALIASIATGVWFIANALQNLGVDWHQIVHR